jgi:hemolysin activation/secretion protein
MKKDLVKRAPLAALSVLVTALAQAAEPPPQIPNAGAILQQNQPSKQPSASSNGTGLSLDKSSANALPASAPFPVSDVQITGNTLFDSATLHALVADVEGKNLTLEQLGDAAARITRYYQEHGYPLARAVIPAQAVRNGVVHLQVIEARYGKIQLDNHSRVDDGLLASILSTLQSGRQIEQQALDHSLLMLSDVPGVITNATLKPGEAVGTSDLGIDANTEQAVTGNISADNYGNRYTGRPRVGGAINFIDLLHHGDVLSLDVLSSGNDMNYGRLSEDILLNGLGTHVGASWSALDYKLGHGLAALGGQGSANVASLWARQTFVRSRGANLYGQLEYDHKRLDDDIDSTAIRTDRHLDEATATLLGDWRDASGVNSWNLAFTQGHLDFDDAAARLSDATTARTQGSFSKWSTNFNRIQAIGQDDIVYLALSGQWSNTNLDASEKMVAGGLYTVRAYDMGVLSGDHGLLGNIEWRHQLGQVLSGQTQATVFFDSEHITINRTPWVAAPNSATLSGAGVGLNWFGPGQTSIQAAVAAPVGSKPELIGSNKSARAWFALSKMF